MFTCILIMMKWVTLRLMPFGWKSWLIIENATPDFEDFTGRGFPLRLFWTTVLSVIIVLFRWLTYKWKWVSIFLNVATLFFSLVLLEVLFIKSFFSEVLELCVLFFWFRNFIAHNLIMNNCFAVIIKLC